MKKKPVKISKDMLREMIVKSAVDIVSEAKKSKNTRDFLEFLDDFSNTPTDTDDLGSSIEVGNPSKWESKTGGLEHYYNEKEMKEMLEGIVGRFAKDYMFLMRNEMLITMPCHGEEQQIKAIFMDNVIYFDCSKARSEDTKDALELYFNQQGYNPEVVGENGYLKIDNPFYKYKNEKPVDNQETEDEPTDSEIGDEDDWVNDL